MWFCKVVILLTIAGFCFGIRRPENNGHDDYSTSTRRVFKQRPRHSSVDEAEPLLPSPTFSILSHMAQPLPIQGEELNAHNDEFTPRSERLPFRSIRKPELRRRSKPSFNINPPGGVQKNFQKRGRLEARDESRKIPPVYVPKVPEISPEEVPIIRNEPEFVLADEEDKFKPIFPNYPIYAQESGPKKEHSTSALLTADPEGNVDIQKEIGIPQVNTNYETEQLKPYAQKEYEQIEVPFEPHYYAPRLPQQQLSKRPDVNFISQNHNQHSVEHNQHITEPEVSTYKPDRLKLPRPINPNKYQQKRPNSYNQFNLEATPYKQPERNVASEPKPRLFKPQNVPKKILRKQPAKAYNNYPTAVKEPQLEKREAYDQQGSHSGLGHLDQNGMEFVSDASKTLQDPGHGRITFQIHGQEGPHSYKFGYDTGKGPHRQFRYEEKDGYGEVKGRYGFYDESGKLQLVNYSAHPEHGYQAEVVPAPKD